MASHSAFHRRLVDGELAAFAAARLDGCSDLAWRCLERAHILSQRQLGLHGRVHLAMLRFAVEQRELREVIGQVVRLLMVPLGHATGRLPLGNTGRAAVSAFTPMSVPPDLGAELAGAGAAPPLQS
jgi:hypothetical protein